MTDIRGPQQLELQQISFERKPEVERSPAVEENLHEAFFHEEVKKSLDDDTEEPKSKPPEAEKPSRLFNASFSADLELP